jgi:hypothetical protein
MVPTRRLLKAHPLVFFGNLCKERSYWRGSAKVVQGKDLRDGERADEMPAADAEAAK